MKELRFKVVTKHGIVSKETDIFEFMYTSLMADTEWLKNIDPESTEYEKVKADFYDEIQFFTPDQYKEIPKQNDNTPTG